MLGTAAPRAKPTRTGIVTAADRDRQRADYGQKFFCAGRRREGRAYPNDVAYAQTKRDPGVPSGDRTAAKDILRHQVGIFDLV